MGYGQEIINMRASASILCTMHREVFSAIEPGVATGALDRLAEEVIRDHGGVPSFKGYVGFPASICVSVNDVVVHGIPGDYILQDGDIVSIDGGVYHCGMHSDAALTHPVGIISTDLMKLIQVTRCALGLGIAAAGGTCKYIGDIGFAIQKYVESYEYGVVRALVGHGIGRKLHEPPEIPNYGCQGGGPMIRAGMFLAIEPMVTQGSYVVKHLRNGVVKTQDGKPAAHFEHTVAIRPDGQVEILTEDLNNIGNLGPFIY